MAEPPAKRTPNTNSRAPNIYCLFATQQSLQEFQAYRKAKMQARSTVPIKADEESSESSLSVVSFKDENQFTLPTVPKVLKIYNCRKCFKELFEQEKQGGVCEECIYLEKLSSSPNFQKFIGHLLEFKAQPFITHQVSKVRRMDSIESIQSFTLDKPHDSQIRPTFPYYNSTKNSTNLIFNSMENTASPTKKTSLADSIQSGYYCNGCAMEPIVGRRFHCLSCDDFDLCEKCYFYSGHKHEMKTFKDLREEIMSRAQKTLKRHQSLQNTLPFLSSSIRDFQKASKQLFKTTALRRH